MPVNSPRTAGGGSDPEKGGAHNRPADLALSSIGGSDPEKGGVDLHFDLGEMFLHDSRGGSLEHPCFYFDGLSRLAMLNQKLARRTRWLCGDCKELADKYRTVKRKKQCIHCRGENISMARSENGWKAKRTLQKHHDHIEHQRENFLWNIAHFYAVTYDSITVFERPWKYKIEYACLEQTAIRLCDGAYGRLVQMLRHKCNEYDKEFISRKDEQWQNEIETIREKAALEGLGQLLRKAARAIKEPSRGRLRSMKRESRIPAILSTSA